MRFFDSSKYYLNYMNCSECSFRRDILVLRRSIKSRRKNERSNGRGDACLVQPVHYIF